MAIEIVDLPITIAMLIFQRISIPQLHPPSYLGCSKPPRPLQPPKPKQRAAAAAPRWQEQLVKAEPSALAKPEPAMSIVAAQAGSRWPWWHSLSFYRKKRHEPKKSVD